MPVDYDLYHPKWPLIRRLVLKRAGNRCEWCTARNYEPHPITGSRVVLTVAHLDHNRKHNRFHNLQALCQRCHLACDLNLHIRNRKYGRYHKENQLNLALNIPAKPFACPQFKVVRMPLPSPPVKVPALLQLFPEVTAATGGVDHGENSKAC